MNLRGPESDQTTLRGVLSRQEFIQDVIDGSVFYAYKSHPTADELVNNAAIEIVVTSSAGIIPAMGFVARIGGTAELDIFEGVTEVTGGSIFVPRNRNRASDRASQVGVIINPTSVTTNGVLYEEQIIGGTGGNAAGASVSNDYALIKPDTSYLFRLTNRSGQARVAELFLQWVE